MAVRVTREKLISWGYDPDMLDRLIGGSRPELGDPTGGMGRRGPTHAAGVMNHTEQRFATLLATGRWIAPVRSWAFEPITLQLAPDMTFRPDFIVIREDGSKDAIDCKGEHVFEDATVKAKACAVICPEYRVYQAKLASGRWRVRQLGVVPRRTIILPA